MRKVTFDIETKNVFSDVGRADPSLLDIAVVAIHDSESNEFASFLEDELHKLWPILERADLLIGYNSDHFDIPLLNKYYSGNLNHIKSIDLLKEIKNVLGKRLRLDNVAEATLGRNKTGSGMEALGWWKKGEVEKVRDYCIEDVRITKEIYDFALENGVVKYKDLGEVKTVQLDTKDWERKRESSMTYTLPF